MKITRLLSALGILTGCVTTCVSLASCWTSPASDSAALIHAARAQVPTWSDDDLQFFLHGSMSTEVVPEAVLHAFQHTYPDLFPTRDFSYLGAIPDPAFGWPVGFSRANPAHLGGLPGVGINCAACHVGEVESASGHGRVRVLGMTSLFDSEGFFGAIVISGFRTADPANMKKFLAAYLDESDPSAHATTRAQRQQALARAWDVQAAAISTALNADPAGAAGAGPGGLQTLSAADLQLSAQSLAANQDLAHLSVSMLKLFHNIRTALHVPDQPPTKLPPPSGPGRNDAFGALSASLFASPQPAAPVKYGLIWNVQHRSFVHWDGNTRSPLARNLLAAVGLGAPLIGHHAELNFALVQRQTAISERIAPPAYPFTIDRTAAGRGAVLYQTQCASCHTGPETDARLYAPAVVGTDSVRASLFTPPQAEQFNRFLAQLETAGYAPPAVPGIRSTQKYWSPNLAGVWARSPYLHNGSVRTMADLLTPPANRPATFHRGSHFFDETALGYTDQGTYLMDTRTPANSNTGHNYGTTLTPDEKRDLIEYLKSL